MRQGPPPAPDWTHPRAGRRPASVPAALCRHSGHSPQYISRNLGLDEKTNAKFIETYTDYQKEVWALGPRPHHKKGEMKTDAQTEQEIKQRFEMSEKILEALYHHCAIVRFASSSP